MCLALPGKLECIIQPETNENPLGQVSFDGVIKTVDLSFVPEAGLGDYLIVHAGFAITVLNKVEAEASLKLLREMQARQESNG